MRLEQKLLLFLFADILCLSAVELKAQQREHSREKIQLNYAVGADLSFLKMAEDSGTVFKDQGVAKLGLEIFHDHGYNWIRLRLFHSPTRLPNDLDYTIALAKEAQKYGSNFSRLPLC